jgi:hypothetical protein
MDRSPLHKAFAAHRQGAKQRGIAFDFTFESWLAAWNASGKLPLRGVKKGGYVMARHGDQGAYEPSNVTIKTQRENLQEARSILAAKERDQFEATNGMTVLEWLKQAIDWHFKVAGTLPVDDPRWPPFRVIWPEFVSADGAVPEPEARAA